MAPTEGHAFISYVREDAARVDRLQRILEAAGIPVWRDTQDLWPGEDWRGRIRHAITKNALAFIACFSEHSEARTVSGQNEELMLAVEQLRLRRPDHPWLIPVRFAEVDLPDIDVGGGRTLNSIQRADLLGDGWDEGAARLVGAVLRALDRPAAATLPAPAATLQTQLKAALRDPAGDIAVTDLLMPLATSVRDLLGEEMFPPTSEGLRGSEVDAAYYIADVAESCIEAMNPALDALIVAAQWIRQDQRQTLSRFIERLAPQSPGGSGMVVLVGLRWFPVLPLIYVGALAALHQDNYVALKAIALDASVRDPNDGRLPLIARSNPWRPFSNFELAPQVLALRAAGQDPSRELVEALRTGRQGKRYTPVSDYLHDTLRPKFATELPDDEDFSDLFDRVEILLSLLVIDAAKQYEGQQVYIDPPYFGRFTWRARYRRPGDKSEDVLARELSEQQERWPPIAAGLFGGSVERASAALERFREWADETRTRRLFL